MLVCDFLAFLLDDTLEYARMQNLQQPDPALFEGTCLAIQECREAMTGDGLCDRFGALLAVAKADAAAAMEAGTPDEMFWAAREMQIEWIASVVSIILLNQGFPAIVPPTRGAAMEAARLLGVIGNDGAHGA